MNWIILLSGVSGFIGGIIGAYILYYFKVSLFLYTSLEQIKDLRMMNDDLKKRMISIQEGLQKLTNYRKEKDGSR